MKSSRFFHVEAHHGWLATSLGDRYEPFSNQHRMADIYQLLLERNARETDPFVSIHEANATLLNQVDALRNKCDAAEREISTLRQQLSEASSSSAGPKSNAAAATAALKSEARLRDKLEKLQEEINSKLKGEAEEQASALKTAKDLSDMKDINTAQEKTIGNLREENDRQERVIEHVTNEMNDAKSRMDLAEKQYDGLKKTIRSLQEENDQLKKENRQLEERLVAGKGKTVDEMNVLTDMVNALKMEVDMLRSYKLQEDKRRSWFGGGSPVAGHKDGKQQEQSTKGKSGSRKWGSFGVVVPSSIKQRVAAHNMEGTCVKYDETGTDLIATASSDSTVKIWDSNTGQVRATLRGTSGHTIMCCDISGGIVVGAGSDKTCRVWNLRTERMVCKVLCYDKLFDSAPHTESPDLQIHHLVGHAHKITCVRLIGGDKTVITGSADRSLKVWDISRATYLQTLTLRHGSTSNCVDVGSDSVTAVSGHLDGGIRFWDIRSGERTADISGR